ncbi:hypothetical protein [Wenzhouxiangella sp. EGI_FJ10305]|uniref:hypothetical protein n=1 Tax=Wenzhouxiangella sp. EGI_FJ10305 TaxID=3243768 RepID=UPI0035E1CC50
MTNDTDTSKDTTANPGRYQNARAEYETPTMVISNLRVVTLGGSPGINDSGAEGSQSPQQ